MEEPTTPVEEGAVPEVGGNWFILLGAVPALAGLAVAAWLALSAGSGPPAPPPPPPPPPSTSGR